MLLNYNYITIKKLFHYYILRLFSFIIIFLIFFSLFSSLQKSCDIYFFHILFLIFFLLQTSFCIYLLLIPLIYLYYFYNNLLLCLTPHLGFFDNKLNHYFQWNCIHSFLYIAKKSYKIPLLSTKLEPFTMLIASSLLIYQK